MSSSASTIETSVSPDTSASKASRYAAFAAASQRFIASGNAVSQSAQGVLVATVRSALVGSGESDIVAAVLILAFVFVISLNDTGHQIMTHDINVGEPNNPDFINFLQHLRGFREARFGTAR